MTSPLEDDDGFHYYIPDSVDPGYTLLIFTICICLLTNAILPCLVSMGRKYEKRKIEKESVDVNEGMIEKSQSKASNVESSSGPGEISKRSDLGSQVKGTTWKSLLDQIITPPYPDDNSSVLGGSAAIRGVRNNSTDIAGNEENRSGLSASSPKSSSFWETTPLDASMGPRVGLSGMRRQRLALGDKELRRQDNRVELAADREEYLSLITNDFDAVDSTGVTQNHVLDIKPGRSEVASRVSSHAYSRTTGVRSRRGNRDGSSLSGNSRRRGDGSANSGASRRRGNSPEPSILSGLEDHVISPNDAADANDPGYYILPKQEVEDDQDIDICWGKRAWWRPIILMEGFNRLVHLSEYDYEMKRVLKLCVPYSITALLEGVVDSIHVGLVSQFIGTEAVAAYTMVHVILGITSQFMKGILDSEATLCSHAVGAGNYALAGQYVQVCTLIFTALMIPNIALWTFYLDDVILLFGFEKHVALLGLEYGRVFLFHEWLKGIYSAYAGLLNVIGYENFITTMVVVEGLVSVACTAVLVLFRDATLQEVAMVHLAVGLVFFLAMVWISICHGRMHKFLSGMFGTCAILNKGPVRNVLATAIPIGFGSLLEYSEWEILTIFTARLGTAEVAAWGILGSLWETFETLCKGIGDGGEVRCAYHLGNGNPGMAQISAYKSVLLSICASFFFTSFLFITGQNLAIVFTSDPALQNMIVDLLPLLGVGNIFLTAGCVSWALVGAQARYRLATLIALVSSWGITLPLAAFMTYGLHLNLQGITAAVVIGYSFTCTALNYVLLRSDWERISKHVVELNDESDDESSEDSAREDEEGSQAEGSPNKSR